MSLINNFKIPSWAGKPPSGLHLDVSKEKKMVQKLMIDQKKCYFFGRNKQMCDFHIDHASCSRVHTALVWHSHLNRPFLIDLSSTHGTYIGSVRIDSNKPQQVAMDSNIHFGASTRCYTIRERPKGLHGCTTVMEAGECEEIDNTILGLPENEAELSNLTEFNTAHNRRIADITDAPSGPGQLPLAPRHTTKRQLSKEQRRRHVDFNEEEQIINPEDVDPSIGRFRNLMQTVVVPSKKAKIDHRKPNLSEIYFKKQELAMKAAAAAKASLYSDIDNDGAANLHHQQQQEEQEEEEKIQKKEELASMCGLRMPNPAPDIEQIEMIVPTRPKAQPIRLAASLKSDTSASTHKKKKYAKEAWPGRNPLKH